MAIYSHSKISTFETCPYKYKLKYIHRIPEEIQNTIEAFIGDLVHRTLEKLYKDKWFQKDVSKQELLNYYNYLWKREYSNDILIVKENQGFGSENYRKMGEKFISDYYDKMKPFDEMTILGLETMDKMTLPDGNQWHVRIDKLGCDSNGNYYVCDYKTNSKMKDQEEADLDRQLAMYSIWVKNKFSDVKSVKLVWYMLAFNKEVISERTDEQLEKLQQEICNKIKEIENATEFPRRQTALCNYCGYKSQCPSFKHQLEVKNKPIQEFKEDDGVKFVDEYAKIKKQLQELREKEEELKNNLIEFSKQKEVDVIYGSNMKCSIREFDKIVLPEDKEALIELMKQKGVWNDFSMINFMKFQSKFVKNELHSEIKDMINREKDFKINVSKRKDIGNE